MLGRKLQEMTVVRSRILALHLRRSLLVLVLVAVVSYCIVSHCTEVTRVQEIITFCQSAAQSCCMQRSIILFRATPYRKTHLHNINQSINQSINNETNKTRECCRVVLCSLGTVEMVSERQTDMRTDRRTDTAVVFAFVPQHILPVVLLHKC